ncbi:hypothetical protein AC1031_005312 [Aphanomyces cochlioides]|nr:hypothetical protein AC1031_005312 [Aphanomyces cochlioides]
MKMATIAAFITAVLFNAVACGAAYDGRPVPPVTNNGVSSFNWCGKRKWIALTFDDLLRRGPVADILADLKANNMTASFFVYPADDTEENFCAQLKSIHAAGHSINHHSYSHESFLELPAEKRAQEILKTEEFVYKTCGMSAGLMKYFRPPNGDLNRTTALEVNSFGYTVLSWTTDPQDWNESNNTLATVWANSIRAFNALPEGSSAVILHHTWAYDARRTKGLITKYKEYFTPLGYEFVSVDQCFQACLADGDCKLATSLPGVYDE